MKAWNVGFAIASMLLIVGCHSNDGSGSATQGAQTVTPNYLPATSVDPMAIANTPPYLVGSPGDEQELQQLMGLQVSRSSADCQRAGTEVTINLENFFGPAYGPLTAAQVKQWKTFFGHIADDVNTVVTYGKTYFNRPRPFKEDPSIQPCIAPPSTPSFPSGHAATAEVFARVLEVLLPTLKAQIDARANQIAMDRSIAGVHRESEIQAGMDLGDLIFEQMQKDPNFLTQLKSQ